MSATPRPTPPTGLLATLFLFGAPATAMFVATRFAIPNAVQTSGWAPIIWWFAIGGFWVFAPLIFMALGGLRVETDETASLWRQRLRFRLNWGLHGRTLGGALAAIAVLTALIAVLLPQLGVPIVRPAFLALAPLSGSEAWLWWTAVAFVVWNVFCQEILWRGVILPRHEVQFGETAWRVNAAGGVIFNLAFGSTALLLMLPALIIIPYAAQRTRSTPVALVLHVTVQLAALWFVLR